MTLPLFHYLKTGKGEYLIARLANYLSCQSKLVIFLCVIPLTLCRMTGLVYYNPIYYILFFILGFLFLLDRRFERVIDKNNTIALVLALTGTLFYLYSNISEYHLVFGEFSIFNVLIQLLLSLSSFCWLIILLNFARRYMNWSNSLIAYLNQASYPIYIIHMTFVIPIGFYTVQWNAGIIVKFIFVIFASTLSIILVYDILIKRFQLTRFLFGMKPKVEN